MKKIYIKPQIEQIMTYEDTAICVTGSLYDDDMPAKGGKRRREKNLWDDPIYLKPHSY